VLLTGFALVWSIAWSPLFWGSLLRHSTQLFSGWGVGAGGSRVDVEGGGQVLTPPVSNGAGAGLCVGLCSQCSCPAQPALLTQLFYKTTVFSPLFLAADILFFSYSRLVSSHFVCALRVYACFTHASSSSSSDIVR
jgi:hypothetical protein